MKQPLENPLLPQNLTYDNIYNTILTGTHEEFLKLLKNNPNGLIKFFHELIPNFKHAEREIKIRLYSDWGTSIDEILLEKSKTINSNLLEKFSLQRISQIIEFIPVLPKCLSMEEKNILLTTALFENVDYFCNNRFNFKRFDLHLKPNGSTHNLEIAIALGGNLKSKNINSIQNETFFDSFISNILFNNIFDNIYYKGIDNIGGYEIIEFIVKNNIEISSNQPLYLKSLNKLIQQKIFENQTQDQNTDLTKLKRFLDHVNILQARLEQQHSLSIEEVNEISSLTYDNIYYTILTGTHEEFLKLLKNNPNGLIKFFHELIPNFKHEEYKRRVTLYSDWGTSIDEIYLEESETINSNLVKKFSLQRISQIVEFIPVLSECLSVEEKNILLTTALFENVDYLCDHRFNFKRFDRFLKPNSSTDNLEVALALGGSLKSQNINSIQNETFFDSFINNILFNNIFDNIYYKGIDNIRGYEVIEFIVKNNIEISSNQPLYLESLNKLIQQKISENQTQDQNTDLTKLKRFLDHVNVLQARLEQEHSLSVEEVNEISSPTSLPRIRVNKNNKYLS